MVDFSTLVLGPCMDIFGGPTDRNEPIIWMPTVSRPTSPPLPVRGIWRVMDTDVVLEDGSVMSTSTITLGVKLDEWPWYPQVGDGFMAPLGSYLIDKVRPDGMGGASLVLKAGQPLPLNG